MNILTMAIASTFNSQRKYLRWHLKPTAFFWGVFGAWFPAGWETEPLWQ